MAWVSDPTSWEVSWTSGVGGWPRWIGVSLEVIMQAGTRWAFLVVAAFLLGFGRIRWGLTVLTGCAAAWLGARALKTVFDRPRPTAVQFGRALRESPDAFSFPSSHATIATALVVAVLTAMWLDGRRSPIAVVSGAVVVVGTCLGRMYVGVHWPLDVVAGVALGAACAVLAAWLVGAVGTRITSRPAPT